MSSPDSSPDGSDGLDELEGALERFLERRRRGEAVSFAEFLSTDPDQANAGRDIAEMLELLEGVGEDHRHAQGLGAFDSGLAAGEAGTSGAATGRTLGDYRIVREIGRGGMGVVYEAEELALLRRVALKVLPLGTNAHPRRVERFRREARAVARLNHQHIVPIYAIGSEDDAHFYTMPLVQGEGLDTILVELQRLRDSVSEEEQSPSSPSSSSSSALRIHEPSAYFLNVARIGSESAAALEHAHGQGILHRDVKPSNILIDKDDKTWLTDFGLAKDTSSDTMTRSGDVVGTLAYMSPESTRGWSDPRSDVYSLGLTLYELATLQPAFRSADGAVLLERIVRDDPPAPRRVFQEVPRDLETIILRATEKEPNARYQTARELREDLDAFREGRPIQARRAGSVERGWRFVRRNPALSVSSVVAIVLVFTVAVVFWINRRLDIAEREARFLSAVSDSEADSSAERAGHRVTGLALVDAARDLLGSLEIEESERRDRLVALRELAIRHELGVDVAVVDRIAGRTLTDSGIVAVDSALARGVHVRRRIAIVRDLQNPQDLSAERHCGPPLDLRTEWISDPPEWSAAGRYLAIKYYPHHMAVFDLDDAQREPLVFRDRQPRRMRFDLSTSEELFAFASSGGQPRLELIELATGDQRATLDLEEPVVDVAISSLDDLVAVAHEKRVLFLSTKDLSADGRPLVIGERIHAISWSLDAASLAIASERRCQIFGIDDDSPRVVLLEPGVRFLDVRHSPDDRLLLTSTSDGVFRLWNAVTGRRVLSLRGEVVERQLRFAHGGKLLIEPPRLAPWIRARRSERAEDRDSSDRGPLDTTSLRALRLERDTSLRRIVPMRHAGRLSWGNGDSDLLSTRSGRVVRWTLGGDVEQMARKPKELSAVDETGYVDEVLVDREEGSEPRLVLVGERGIGIAAVPSTTAERIGEVDWIETGVVGRVSLSPHGRYLAVIIPVAGARVPRTRPAHVRLYDLRERRQIFETPRPRKIEFAVVSPDASVVIFADRSQVFRVPVRESTSDEVARRPEVLSGDLSDVTNLRFSRDGESLIALCRDRRLRVDVSSWAVVDERERGFFDQSSSGLGRGIRRVSPITANLDGSLLATIDGRSDRVRLEQQPGGGLIARLDLGLSEPVEEISLSPRARFLVARSPTQGIEIWDLTALRARLSARRLDW